jgi:hypothetical protein
MPDDSFKEFVLDPLGELPEVRVPAGTPEISPAHRAGFIAQHLNPS